MSPADKAALAELIAANPDLDPVELTDAYEAMADTEAADWHPYTDAEAMAHALVRQRLGEYLSEPGDRSSLALGALLDEEAEAAAANDDDAVTIRLAVLSNLLSDFAMTLDALAGGPLRSTPLDTLPHRLTGVGRLDDYVRARRTSDAAGWAWVAVHGAPGEETR